MTEQSTVEQVSGEETRSYAELLDPEVLADPYPLYENLRTTDPVHWDPYLHAWIVTGYDDVTTVLKRFSARRTPPPEYFELLGVPEVAPVAELMVRRCCSWTPRSTPGVRRLASAAFTPGRVAVLDARIAEIGDQLLDDVLARGTGPMDLMADFADPLPAIVTAELLGVPVADPWTLKRLVDDVRRDARQLPAQPRTPRRRARGRAEPGRLLHRTGRGPARGAGGRAGLGLHRRRGRRRPVHRRGDRRQLHRHDGRRPGDHDEPDRQRPARAAARPRGAGPAARRTGADGLRGGGTAALREPQPAHRPPRAPRPRARAASRSPASRP